MPFRQMQNYADNVHIRAYMREYAQIFTNICRNVDMRIEKKWRMAISYCHPVFQQSFVDGTNNSDQILHRYVSVRSFTSQT